MRLNTLFKIVWVSLIVLGTILVNPFLNAAYSAPQDPDLGVCAPPRNWVAAREDARQLVNQIRTDLATVEDQIRNAPFLANVEAGTASLEQIASVAAEQYSIIRSDSSSFAQMTARFDDPQSRQFFGGMTSGEAIAQQLLIDFASTVGLNEHDLAAYEPRPSAQTYPSRVAWIAANADRAVAGASFLANFGVFGENMGRLHDALVNIYGFSPDEVRFFSFFSGPNPTFEENAIEVIAAGLRRGACSTEARRSARLLQAYELDFWQAMDEPLGSPLPVVR